MKCSVWNCERNQASKGVRFYRFPLDPKIRSEWIRRCVRSEQDISEFVVNGCSRVCSDHFPNGKINEDNVIQLPVITVTPEDLLLPMKKKLSKRKIKEDRNILIAPHPAGLDNKSKVAKVDLSVIDNKPNEYCRICLRIVASKILQPVTKNLNARIFNLFAFKFPLNTSQRYYICVNCIHLMTINIDFHRAVRKAHKIQSRLKQNFRLERHQFWNHGEHIQTIAQCKEIVLQHGEAIDELCGSVAEKMVHTISDSITEDLPTDECIETSAANCKTIPKTQDEESLKVEYIIDEMDIAETIGAIPEALIEPIQNLLVKPEVDLSEKILYSSGTIKCETVSKHNNDQMDLAETLNATSETLPESVQIDKHESDDDFTWPMDQKFGGLKPPNPRSKNKPESVKQQQPLDPSKQVIPYPKRHKLPVPVYVSGLCDICGKRTDQSQTEAHKNQHLGVKPYTCDHADCGATFYGRHALVCHKRRFHDPVVRECDVCGKTIRGGSWNFKHHMKTHLERERVFQCPLCDLKFYTDHTMKKHLVKHQEANTHVSKGLSRLRKK